MATTCLCSAPLMLVICAVPPLWGLGAVETSREESFLSLEHRDNMSPTTIWQPTAASLHHIYLLARLKNSGGRTGKHNRSIATTIYFILSSRIILHGMCNRPAPGGEGGSGDLCRGFYPITRDIARGSRSPPDSDKKQHPYVTYSLIPLKNRGEPEQQHHSS